MGLQIVGPKLGQGAVLQGEVDGQFEAHVALAHIGPLLDALNSEYLRLVFGDRNDAVVVVALDGRELGGMVMPMRWPA